MPIQKELIITTMLEIEPNKTHGEELPTKLPN